MIARLRKLIQRVERASKKPLSVILLRIHQSIVLAVHTHLGVFGYQAGRIVARWGRPGALDALLAENHLSSLPITTAAIDTARRQLADDPAEKAVFATLYDEVIGGKIAIFGTILELGKGGPYPWNSDWRYGHHWSNRSAHSYDFYEYDKTVPYDVKFPWELSRLNFLVAPTLLATLETRSEWWGHLDQVLGDWQDHNPVAHSIGWHAMEVSMRSINLVFMANLALHAGTPAENALRRILALCEIHGMFLFRALEYSDVRGNHYAANLTALTMLGSLLLPAVGEAKRWLELARGRIDSEIQLQYCDDGVQFEKSIPYHRLVTELFLLAAITFEARGQGIGDVAKVRLRKACEYTAAYTRPDGLAPLWGDNDDARALWFDAGHKATGAASDPGEYLRDHRGLINLGAVFFAAPDLLAGRDMEEASTLAVALLLPGREVAASEVAGCHKPAFRYFDSGGMVIADEANFHLVMDVGEVGMKGWGGHGHLDALSFEVSLGGEPLIIDPGSYVYTGDPAARDEFRATGAHNIVRIDGREMADLPERRMWQLGREADPHDVVAQKTGTGFRVSVRHSGYSGLPDPVVIARELTWDRGQAELRIIDRVECDGQHDVERFYHLAPGVKAELRPETLTMTTPRGQCYVMSWDEGAQAELRHDWVSHNYARRTESETLVLSNQIVKVSEFFAVICRASG